MKSLEQSLRSYFCEVSNKIHSLRANSGSFSETVIALGSDPDHPYLTVSDGYVKNKPQKVQEAIYSNLGHLFRRLTGLGQVEGLLDAVSSVAIQLADRIKGEFSWLATMIAGWNEERNIINFPKFAVYREHERGPSRTVDLSGGFQALILQPNGDVPRVFAPGLAFDLIDNGTQLLLQFVPESQETNIFFEKISSLALPKAEIKFGLPERHHNKFRPADRTSDN